MKFIEFFSNYTYEGQIRLFRDCTQEEVIERSFLEWVTLNNHKINQCYWYEMDDQ